MPSDERATLFEHCARGLDRSLALGRHGLPLIGGGDWNDGLNRVGAGGQGESIWLGWFLHATIANFVAFADQRGQHDRAASWRHHATSLRDALEREGWDGDWYRRGYFDDGTPLGSASSSECRIDSIAQSWGVISGAADPARAARAMAAVDETSSCVMMDWLCCSRRPSIKPHWTRLHQGLSAGNPREWRSIYSCCYLVGSSIRQAWRWGQGSGVVFAPQSNQPRSHLGRRSTLQGRTVCGVCGCLLRSATRGAGRLDVVHGLGGLYRAGLESILGFTVEGTTLRLDPCVPRAWRDFEIVFRHHTTRYEVFVENHTGFAVAFPAWNWMTKRSLTVRPTSLWWMTVPSIMYE